VCNVYQSTMLVRLITLKDRVFRILIFEIKIPFITYISALLLGAIVALAVAGGQAEPQPLLPHRVLVSSSAGRRPPPC
jgi:hypothetical protein